MKFESVEIYNFRSIKEFVLTLDSIDGVYSKIFLGKNESGKSSILRALSMINNSELLDYQADCNKDAFKEKESIEIIYNFDIDIDFYQTEMNKCTFIDEQLLEQIKFEGIQKIVNCDSDGAIDNFYNLSLNIPADTSRNYVFEYSTKEFKNIVNVYSGDEILNYKNIKTLLPGYTFAYHYLIRKQIAYFLQDLLIKNTPSVIHWNSSNRYLINEPINLIDFRDNLNTSIVLKNIFNIANIEDKDILERLEDCELYEEEREELADILSEEVTKHINKIWKEHNISIKVTIESDLYCRVKVYDNDNKRPKYKMEQRSDGFKQFVSILLVLSAENKSNKLKNSLILLDEPEVHLHPSGIKYLKNELFDIARNNIVLIATHSVYMIDKVNLNRHYSVIKNKSLTDVTQIEKDNPYQEEVIYEALGTSVYEHIEPNVIIFEGKTDKDIFDAFANKFKKDLKIKNITSLSADGVTNIPKYVKFFNNKLVKGFVVVDSDPEGIKVKKSVLSENKNFNLKNTFDINSILQTNKESTLEDLLPKEIIENVLIEKFESELELDITQPFIKQIKTRYRHLNEKELKVNILEAVFDDLNSKSTLKEKKEKYQKYFDFTSNLYSSVTT